MARSPDAHPRRLPFQLNGPGISRSCTAIQTIPSKPANSSNVLLFSTGEAITGGCWFGKPLREPCLLGNHLCSLSFFGLNRKCESKVRTSDLGGPPFWKKASATKEVVPFEEGRPGRWSPDLSGGNRPGKSGFHSRCQVRRDWFLIHKSLNKTNPHWFFPIFWQDPDKNGCQILILYQN